METRTTLIRYFINDIDPQRTSDWQKARRCNNSLNYASHLKARGGV